MEKQRANGTKAELAARIAELEKELEAAKSARNRDAEGWTSLTQTYRENSDRDRARHAETRKERDDAYAVLRPAIAEALTAVVDARFALADGTGPVAERLAAARGALERTLAVKALWCPPLDERLLGIIGPVVLGGLGLYAMLGGLWGRANKGSGDGAAAAGGAANGSV